MAENWEKIEIGLRDMVNWETTKEISGKLIKIDTEVGTNGSTVYVLAKEDESEVSFWGSAVLDSRFEKIELGSFVKVVFTGKVDGKNGRSYRGFDVFVKK